VEKAVFVVFKFSPATLIIQMWTGHPHPQGEDLMHDLLIALAFIGMVVAPAIVAAKSGSEVADELED
jgi:Mn2+/Fe2+ NRAMP family transporter